MGRSLLAALAVSAVVGGAGPAHADQQSYLAYLASHGTRVMAFDDATRISYGLQACQFLHSGMSPDQVASMVSPSDTRGILDAAQHELCPDTLR